MYFKVIKNGTNRKLVYDFLFDVDSNLCRITHRFWEIWSETVQWPWNMTKVIDSRITWKLSCGQKLAMYVKCSEDRERKKRKLPFSTTPFSFDAPSPANPREYLYNLIPPESTFPGLHFCRWQYMGSSASFRTVLSVIRRRQPISCQVRNRF